MTGLPALRIPAQSFSCVLVFFGLLAFTGPADAASPPKSEGSIALLVEARGAAASIEDAAERSAALNSVVVAQIAIDPPGARETLKLFPRSPRKLHYLTALAAAYAEAGNIAETDRMYAEIVVEDQSSRPGKLAAANALGQVAIAYANKGNIEEASQTLSRLKERLKEEPLSIVGLATAKLVEAQVKHGDIRGAVQTALTIIEENPVPFLTIIRDRVLSGKVQEVQNITAALDERAQPYAQWGIMQAQIQQGRSTDAQVTASAIKPGHAKADALLELATYHLQHGTNPLALVLLQEAEASARMMANPKTRAESLQHITASTAMAGDAARATTIARSIEKEGPRIAAFHDIVNAQAKRGEFAGAFNAATLLKQAPRSNALTMSDYDMAVSDILVELVKAGKGMEARNTVAKFQDTDISRSWLYSGIAMAQADLGNIKEAEADLALAETRGQRSARRKELLQVKEKIRLSQNPTDETRFQELWKAEVEIQRGLDAIAKAFARKGDLSGAMAIADELNQPAHRLDLIKELSALHVQAGRKEQTLRWARSLSRSSEKAFALVGMATVFSQEADKRKAKPVLKAGV